MGRNSSFKANSHELPAPGEIRLSVAGWIEQSWRREDGGDVAGALAAVKAGLEVARREQLPDPLLELLCQKARLKRVGGDWLAAIEIIASAEPLAKRCSDQRILAGYWSLYAYYVSEFGELEKTAVFNRLALACARKAGSEALYLAQTRHGLCLLATNRAGEAVKVFTDAIATLRLLPPGPNAGYRWCYSPSLLGHALTELAAEAAARDQPIESCALARADQVLTEALKLAQESVPVLRFEVQVNLGRCRSLRGIVDETCRRALLDASFKDLVSCSNLRLISVIAWARYEAEIRGDVAFARQVLDRVIEVRTDRSLLPWLHHWHAASAAVHRVEGRFDEAALDLETAYDAVRDLRAHQVAVILDMAERVSEAEASRRRERAAALRAARLRTRNEELSAEKQRLAERALTDPLTGLGNRRRLEQEVARMEARSLRRETTVAIIDIDHFKSINDRYSHQVGDQVIAMVASRLSQSARRNDLCVRYGGEEFLILFKGEVSPRRLDKVRLAVQSLDWSPLAPDLRVTVSIGAAPWESSTPFAAALSLADKRLYTAKFLGRNRCVVE